MSYGTAEEGKGKIVNRFVAEEAKRRGVVIRPLSYFVAEFTGPPSQIEWFRRNYAVLLCGFNPEMVINDEAAYRSCSGHVREWMKLVDEGKYENLMDDQFLFCPNCCTTP
ncbi:MAG: hypothetical protein JSS49_08560 [Planctomycetes bacterium]|nr:hypothetical protein [Planctomycetota bacterium]